MTERQIWFVTPPKAPWNFVQPVHSKGWAVMIGALLLLVAVIGACISAILVTLNPLWVFGVVAAPMMVFVPFFVIVQKHTGPRQDSAS